MSKDRLQDPEAPTKSCSPVYSQFTETQELELRAGEWVVEHIVLDALLLLLTTLMSPIRIKLILNTPHVQIAPQLYTATFGLLIKHITKCEAVQMKGSRDLTDR